MEKMYVIINGDNKSKESWGNYVWSELGENTKIYCSNSILNNIFLRKILIVHFSNKLNRKVWLPFKHVWDKFACVDINDLDKKYNNIFIFQTSVKFSPRLIKKLKKTKNAYIVLYMPDTLSAIGVASNQKELDRYCRYYSIDKVYSFDYEDCKKYKLTFFDIYSSYKESNNMDFNQIYYIGKIRHEDRLNEVLGLYKILSNYVKCDFNLVGVDNDKQGYLDSVNYCNEIPYKEVINSVVSSKFILELVNKNQTGNTLRLKEAVCYDKRLITNNAYAKISKYYNQDYIYVFDRVENINLPELLEWINRDVVVDFHYQGDFSPVRLKELIVDEISRLVNRV